MVIPAGAGLRVDRQSALSSFSSGGLDLVEKGDFLETPEFDTRSVRILLNIESGVSSFRIRQSEETRVGTSI
jgi:hypothetical protein